MIFLVVFFKCWKYLSNSSETFKILFFHQNNQFEAKTACFVDFSILPKSLYPDLTGVGILLVDFLVEFFNWWKYPSNSSEIFQILFLHQNNQFEAKTACFLDFSILTKIAVFGPYRRGNFVGWFFGWVFQLLKIPFEFFWNIQNFVLSSKQSFWRKNSMFYGLLNVDQNRCIRTLPAWPFFWLIFWNVENTLPILLKHSKFCSFIKTTSLKQKQHVLWTFQFWQKSLYPDLTGVAILLVDFLKCWKYPSNSTETFKILFVHQNNQFEAKTACFADFSILTKIAVSGPYRRGHFVSWFFWLYFSNVENTLRILLKHSKFCSFIKTTSLKQKPHVLWTFQFWPKSLYPDLTSVAILLVDFFGCIFQMLKIPFEFFWNIQNFVLSSKQPDWSKNSMFFGLFNFDQNRCFRTFTGVAILLVDFLVEFFNCWKYPSNLLKYSKFCSFIKTIILKEKQHVLRTFKFWPKSLYPDLTGVAIWLVYFLVDLFGWFFELLKIPFQFFWNIQNFVLSSKQISLKEKQHVLRTFQFWPKSLYPNLTDVAIFFVHFLKSWKYPSNSSETFEMLFFHQKNQFEQKQHVLRTFQFWPKSLYSDHTGVAIFFLLIFWNLENSLPILLKHSKCCSFIKTISSKQKQHVLRTFKILTKIAVSGPFRRGKFVGWFFWLSFSNGENTLRILLKHSKFCSFIKTISLKQKQNVLWTFQFWPKSLYPDITGVGILLVDFLVEFFNWWKYPSNSSEIFQILFVHQNNQFEGKTACFADFSILTKIAVSGPYRRGHFFHWFFEMLKIPFQFCWNIQNVVLSSKQSVWSKNSMFCGLFNFDQNRCIWTLPTWPFC